jgi:hypothetical protein
VIHEVPEVPDDPERAAEVLAILLQVGVLGPRIEGLERLATAQPMTPELHAELVAIAVEAGLVRAEDVLR